MEDQVSDDENNDVDVVVIIPYYNGSAYIERAIDSVLQQTLPPREFLVVDDGSCESEAKFISEMCKRKGVKLLTKMNGGQGSARNFGVSSSTASFICFLDQDDFYLIDHIHILWEDIPWRDRRFGWIYGDLVEAEGDGSVVRSAMVKRHARHPKTDLVDLLSTDLFVLPSAALISRAAYEAIGGFDEQFMGYEDDDLFLRMFRAGYSNYFVDRPVTTWCIHSESTSYSFRMSRSRYRYFMKLAKQFKDDPDKSRHYVRDCLLPRFRRVFFREARRSLDPTSPIFENRVEISVMYAEFSDIAISCFGVTWRRRLKYKIRRHAITTGNRFLARLL